MSSDSSTQIYFCGSVRGGRDDADLYASMVKILSKYGKVLTPHVGDPNTTILGMEGRNTDKDIHDQDVDMLKCCDVIVAEVTQPSLGVGYELGRGVAMGKQIFCLYRPQEGKKLSAMIRGAAAEDGQSFTVVDYSPKDLEEIFSKLFKHGNAAAIDWKFYSP